MATKFYGVKKGRIPGVYTTWKDCQAQVIGFSGAIYKGFLSKEEANDFVKDVVNENKEKTGSEKVQNKEKISTEIYPTISSILEEPNEDVAVAYVDGSYNNRTKEFSYGAVIAYNGKEYHYSDKMDDEELSAMRNVAGEIKGAEFAMQFAKENNCKKLYIYHDYEGISRWCLGEWKANKLGTKAYQEFYNCIRKTVEIIFVKVKGHSNDTYNDLADELAKKALGIR